MGMTTAEVAAKYRLYAAKCLLLAQDSTEKVELLDMAQAWMTLAEQTEKNEAMLVVYEMPAAPAEGT